MGWQKFQDDYNQPIERWQKGPRNLISDVPGVSVGHHTVRSYRTGVTVIQPATDNVFLQKVPAAVHVINGFGKSTGLMQIEELGTLETPIVLTNTLAVGTAYQALVKQMLIDNPEIGRSTGTVNPVIMECNDGQINDIRALAITEEHVNQAFFACGESFAEGAVGAGTGMCCYGLKGGIGSASRRWTIDHQTFTLGALVLSNFGSLSDLVINHQPIGKALSQAIEEKRAEEKGSIITVLATDLPLDSRQLKRLAKRTSVGITRTGSFIGNGSGEVTLAFSTANRVAHFEETSWSTRKILSEKRMDECFQLTVSVVEEAVISSLIHAESTQDLAGKTIYSLKDAYELLKKRG